MTSGRNFMQNKMKNLSLIDEEEKDKLRPISGNHKLKRKISNELISVTHQSRKNTCDMGSNANLNESRSG